jgi:serine/threonine-protein kinase
MRRATLSLALLTAAAVSSPAPAQAELSKAELAGKAQAVLKTYCQRCHHGPGSDGGEADFLKRSDLVGKQGDEPGYVVPGKPAESLLYQRLAVRRGGKGDMPPSKIGERPSDEDRDVLKRWIEAGAPEFTVPAVAARPFLSLASVLTSIRDHLRKADPDSRPYLRYFSLVHLYNNLRHSDDDLRVTRAALSKALNSLSRKPRIVVPEAVDPAGVILAIDVRDLDWDRDNLWQEVLRAYPYGLKYRNHPALKQLDDELCDLTGCDLAVVRADWFVAAATRPPLYHTLLRIPATAGELERELKVDVAANFLDPRPERIARAGFVKSGVSGQNRLVERHESPLGAYWKSYDFKPDSARANLVRYPLGPLSLFERGKHPYAGQAFVHDGGEIIFPLPNGLQGYMLVNGKDQRIDEGPVPVVSDALKTSGTPAIVTGVSCMACHKHGTLPLTDTVRDSSAVFGEAEKHVRRLYPEARVMTRLVNEDEARFLTALERAIGPFLREPGAPKKPLKELVEPIGEVARAYRLEHLDLQAVACELDVQDPGQLVQAVGETKLKRLGLEALSRPGGAISRLEWEAVDGVSLMQELARELRYTPWGLAK